MGVKRFFKEDFEREPQIGMVTGLAWTSFKKTRDPQEAVLYAVILIPFVLRFLHIK